MPHYRTEHILNLKRLKVFLRLDLGIGKEVPGRAPEKEAEIIQLSQKIEHLSRANSKLKTKISKKDREIHDLRTEPGATTTSGAQSPSTPLPPKDARPCGPTQKDDTTYLRMADADAAKLCDKLGVSPGSSLLDVGCGPGRVAIGLIRRLGDHLEYHGLDVNSRWLGWAHSNLTPRHPGYRFTHLDVKSDRYNPGGSSLPDEFAFPVSDSSFDFVCLFSVFTHMLTDDVRIYLRDFYRVVKPGGRMLVTAFLEDGVPDVEENPKGFLGQDWSGPLHCVRYDRAFFFRMLDEAGFELDLEDPSETFQRHIYVTRRP